MVGFRDLVGTDIPPVSKKTAVKAKQNQALEAQDWRSLALKKSPPQDFIIKDFDKRHKRQTYISTRSTLMPQGSVASSRAA